MRSWWPSPNEAWQLLRDSDPPEWVLRHCACVAGLAVAMAEAAQARHVDVDAKLVQVAAILHDIGRAQTQDPRHAHLGAEALRAAGVAGEVVLCVERHTGAGLTVADSQRIGIPPADYIPATLEEKIVAHADNLYSGDKRLTLETLRGKYLTKGLPDAWARIEALHRELTDVLGVDPQQLPSEPLAMPQ